MSQPFSTEAVVELAIDYDRSSHAFREVIQATLDVSEGVDDLEKAMAKLSGFMAVRHVGCHPAASVVRDSLGSIDVGELAVDLQALLAAGEDERSRYTEFCSLRCRLDGLDVLMAGVAGLVAAVVDVFLVRIPRDLPGQDLTGSSITMWLREHAVDPNNWLARVAKVSFDEMKGHGDVIPGLGSLTHRVHTFGHDPLFGLIIGTLDIMRGTITGVGTNGQIGVADANMAPVSNPALALCLEVMHLLSDVPTACGLPLPGWTALMTITKEVGGRPVNEVAREMYLRGYSTTHVPAMSLSPLSAEGILHAYWHIRSHYDEEFRALNSESEDLAGTTGIADHPRYRALALGAHGLGAALDLGKLAAFGGNPLALNYVQWVAFLRSLYRYTNTELMTPGGSSDALYLQFQKNRRRLQSMLSEVAATAP